MKKEKNCALCRKTSIGGQALMEGIMMRGPAKSAIAVRRPNGEIFFEETENKAKKRPAICRWPVIRGVFGFADSLIIGYRALMRSADIYMEDPAAPHENAETPQDPAETGCAPSEPTPQKPSETPETGSKKAEDGKKATGESTVSKGTMTAISVIAMILGIAVAIGLFVWLPAFLYEQLAKILPEAVAERRFVRSLFEGVLKIAILVAYMALVSLMKDIRRTFMYHGAEHKTIFCYEHGLPLTVENVRAQRRFHPRCGTSFLILMLIVSIFVGLVIPLEFKGIESRVLYTLIRAAIKILLIPVIMGIGYELLKFAGRHDNILTRIISAPGMWLQHITVREPTDDMIECAIRAFEAVVPADESDKW